MAAWCVVAVSQIVYRTDYWYRSAAETARGLTNNKAFTEKELHAINRATPTNSPQVPSLININYGTQMP